MFIAIYYENDEQKITKNTVNDINNSITQIDKLKLMEKEKIYHLKFMDTNYNINKYIQNNLTKIFRISNNTTKTNPVNQLKKFKEILQFLAENYTSFEHLSIKNNKFDENTSDIYAKLCITLINDINSLKLKVNDLIGYELIDYLISNGVNIPDLYYNKSSKILQKYINQGRYNYIIKNWTKLEITKYMNNSFPFDINSLIISYVCLSKII